MRIARMLVAGILAMGLSAQEVVIPRAPLVLAQVPAGQGPVTPARQTTPAPPPPQQPKEKEKSSRKTTWIVVGAVAAGAVAGLVVLNRRLENEGHGIF